ncbi:MAG: WD40 repeat domain-containing protein, partial [Armatimonadetes bacterium]|nr:WD40 repeat domain-containing protein [Armatimonadota bacterium]
MHFIELRNRVLAGLSKALVLFIALAPAFAKADRPNILWMAAGTQASNIAISPDGQTFATSGMFEFSVRIWRVSDGAYIRTIPASYSTIWSIAYSPDGQYIVIGREGVAGDDRATVEIWRVSDGTFVRGLNPGTDDNFTNAWTVAVSPDGKYVGVAFTHYNGIRIYNFNGGLVRTLPSGGYAVAFSPDGKMAAGTINGATRLWQVSNGAVLQTLGQAGTHYAFSPDSTRLAVASESFELPLKIFRTADGVLERSFGGPGDGNVQYKRGIQYSPDGTKLIVGGTHDAAVPLQGNVSDEAIDMWSVSLGTRIWSYRYEYGTSFGIGFTKDGRHVISAGGKSTPLFFDPHGYDNLQKFRAMDGFEELGWAMGRGIMGGLAFSPDSSLVVATGTPNWVQMWNSSTGQTNR